MPEVAPYTYDGPIDHTKTIDWAALRGKSVIVTGGANGMGETTVRRFVEAGAFVTFADVDPVRGGTVESELNKDTERSKFVKCDIKSWEEQCTLFETAAANGRGLHVVIANAGISRSSGDSLWNLSDPAKAPVKPDLNIVNTNVTGTLYTFKLATHWFRKQKDRGGCFIMTGSLNAWIDSPGNWEYGVSKYALRGLMRVVRRNSWEQGLRIAYVAPCYIKSAIRTAEWEAKLLAENAPFGESDDVAACMARIATDETINGHSLMIVPRSLAKEGYMDVGLDDFVEDGYFKSTQAAQLRIIKDRWLDGVPVQTYKK